MSAISSTISSSTRSIRSNSSARTRVTIFNSNFYVPDLQLRNESPGPAKYSQPVSSIKGPAFSFGREGRLQYEKIFKEKTPEHYCYPIKDRAPSFVMGRIIKSSSNLN